MIFIENMQKYLAHDNLKVYFFLGEGNKRQGYHDVNAD